MIKIFLSTAIFLFAVFSLSAQYPEMVKIPGGTFQMGSKKGRDEEKPRHSVTLSSFSMGKYEVTVSEYRAFCKATGKQMPDPPKWGWNDDHPMVSISFESAIAYCKWLSELTGKNYRLPTEAEWEYAARGGSDAANEYAGSNNPDDVAWFADNSGGQTQPVGRKKPNGFGLFDMSGNVWEWCGDWYDAIYYSKSPGFNPTGPENGSSRVLRGGSWMYTPECSRVAFRDHAAPPNMRSKYYGFRVLLAE